MNKIWKLILIITFLQVFLNINSVCAEEKNNLFEKVEQSGESILLTFRDKGIRFRLKLNERDLGVSGYRQVLKLNKKDKLIMKDKHSSFSISPSFQSSEIGINVIMTMRDRFSGEMIKKEYFIKTE